MPKHKYKDIKFRSAALRDIERMNELIGDYVFRQGYVLTTRRMYYLFVSRGWLPNSLKSYAHIQSLLNDARLAGLVDWMAIDDQGRDLKGGTSTNDDEQGIIAQTKSMFSISKWAHQTNRVEVWCEKDGLLGIIGRPCNDYEVSYFSCHGYNSQTEMWKAANRFRDYREDGYRSALLYLGDHDPSGLDMARDIQDRLQLFGAGFVEFRRIAITREQIDEYNPPEFPAKVADSRYQAYIDEHGDGCWEVDALEPAIMDAVIRDNIASFIDEEGWAKSETEEAEGREIFTRLIEHWDAVKDYLKPKPAEPEPTVKPARPMDEKPIELGPAGDPGMTKNPPKPVEDELVDTWDRMDEHLGVTGLNDSMQDAIRRRREALDADNEIPDGFEEEDN